MLMVELKTFSIWLWKRSHPGLQDWCISLYYKTPLLCYLFSIREIVGIRIRLLCQYGCYLSNDGKRNTKVLRFRLEMSEVWCTATKDWLVVLKSSCWLTQEDGNLPVRMGWIVQGKDAPSLLGTDRRIVSECEISFKLDVERCLCH